MDVSQAPLGALAKSMGIRLDMVDGVLVATMPVEGNTQPYGILHGGATAVLVETLGSVASALASPGRLPVGIELSVTHHRSAQTGSVTGRAEQVHLGRTLASWLVPVIDDSGQRIATGRLTCLLRDASR
jgi:uncharacterized protein (TIGR00369 family)